MENILADVRVMLLIYDVSFSTLERSLDHIFVVMLLIFSHRACQDQASKYSLAHGGKIKLFRSGIMAQENS